LICELDSHGHSGRICHRADLLRILFENLPSDSKSRVHLNKTVTDLNVTEDNVTVTCQDGSVFQGSMILAADGVHSAVRTLTRLLALQEVPTDALYPEEPFTSSFQLVFGTISRPKNFSPGETYESHGKDMSTQLMNGRDRSWFFLYRHLPTATSKRTVYAEEDMKHCIKEMGHITMAPSLTVSDVFAEKTAASMVNLEEGVLQRRSWKRVFLAGDSSRKMTPNIGFGYHSSVWDVAVLVNRLREQVVAHPHDRLTTLALAKIFSEVDGERDSYNKTMMGMSADVTRSSTWQTWPSYILDRFLLPWTYSMSWMSTLIIAPLLKASPVLSWLPEPNFKSGSVPWICIAKPESS
jgi:2-polyprenyl-6-methoxyphenol hydroxylase-like FAD-dependent oxidoreductase